MANNATPTQSGLVNGSAFMKATETSSDNFNKNAYRGGNNGNNKNTSGNMKPGNQNKTDNKKSKPANQNRPRAKKNGAAANYSRSNTKLELPEGLPESIIRRRNQQLDYDRQRAIRDTQRAIREAQLAIRNTNLEKWLADFSKQPLSQESASKTSGTKDDVQRFKKQGRDWLSFKHDMDDPMDHIERLKIVVDRSELPCLEPIFKNTTEDKMNELEDAYNQAGQSNRLEVLWELRGVSKPELRMIFASFKGETTANANVALFLTIMRVPEIVDRIVRYLTPSTVDKTAFAMSCKRTAIAMAGTAEIWNYTRGRLPMDGFEATVPNEDVDLDNLRNPVTSAKTDGDGVRARTLVITPGKAETENSESPYTTALSTMLQFAKDCQRGPQSFRDIAIDGMMFFNTTMFEIMINSMPNLESISIVQCPLMDFSRLPKLLDIIARHPRKVVDGKKQYIKLDFFPFFFKGPDDQGRLGSYGLTYHSPTFLGTAAIAAIIERCYKPALALGMDLLSDSASFWHFVRLLPGPDRLWAYKMRDTFVVRQRTYDKNGANSEQAKEAIKQANIEFANDLIAATRGDGVERIRRVPGVMMRTLSEFILEKNYWRTEARCNVCKGTYTQALFTNRIEPFSKYIVSGKKKDEEDTCRGTGTCWGCKATLFVDHVEDSHFRNWQDMAVAELMGSIHPDNWYKKDPVTREKVDNDAVWVADLDRTQTMLDARRTKFEDLVTNRQSSLAYAAAVAKHMDEAWKYYMTIGTPTPHNSINGSHRVQFPEPDLIHFQQQGAVRRLRWKLVGPFTQDVDYREGGPQLTHPCNRPNPLVKEDVTQTWDQFFKLWKWTRRTDETHAHWCQDVLHGIDGALENEDYILNIRDPIIVGHVAWFRAQPRIGSPEMDQKHIAKREYPAQIDFDFDTFRYLQSLLEGETIAIPTLGHLPYNLDDNWRPKPARVSNEWTGHNYRQGLLW